MTDRPTSSLPPTSGQPAFEHGTGPELTCLDGEADAAAMQRLADERVVHGLLLTLLSADRAAMDARVREAVGELSRRPRPTTDHLDRLPAPPPDWTQARRRRLRSLTARAASALALALLVLVLGRISMQSQQAIADPLEQVVREHVKAGDRAGPRRYAMRIERDTPSGTTTTRGLVDVAPGPARRPDGSMGRGGRFVVRVLDIDGPAGSARGAADRGDRPVPWAFGFDGDRFWLLPEDGKVREGDSRSTIEEGNPLRGVISWLIVERALQQLQEQGSSRRAGRADGPRFDLEVDVLDDGRRRHTLRRRQDPAKADSAGPVQRPSEVVFVSGADGRVLSELDVFWPLDSAGRSRHPARIRHVRLELLRDQVPPPEWRWFGPRAHLRGPLEPREEAGPPRLRRAAPQRDASR